MRGKSPFGNAKYFTTFDLECGHWQVKMDDKDKEETAFACDRGLFERDIMPFGLSNAHAIYQELKSRPNTELFRM